MGFDWKFIVRYQVYLELCSFDLSSGKRTFYSSVQASYSFIALKFFRICRLYQNEAFFPTWPTASICQILMEHYSRKQTLSRLYDTVISQHYLKERAMLCMELIIYLQNKVFGGLRTVQLMKEHHAERPQNQKYDQMYIKANLFSAALFVKIFCFILLCAVCIIFVICI